MEDISNILLKELDGGALSPEEIKTLFAEKHFSGISGDMAQDALSALEGKLLVRQNQDGTWSKL